MRLNEKLKREILEDLKGIDMLRFDEYVLANRNLIISNYDAGILDDESMKESLEIAVVNQAQRDYEVLIRTDTLTDAADHVGRTDCFAYALENGHFTPGEIGNIYFDHGDTLATYILKNRKENLISDLRAKILNIKPVSNKGGSYIA